MANQQLHKGASSIIKADRLILSDRTGSSGCNISAPAGSSYQMTGARVGFSSPPSNTDIGLNQSNYIWTNRDVPNIVFTLPSGAPEGFGATFIMSGGQMHVSPSNVGRFFHMASGDFRPVGQTRILQSSGSVLTVKADGNNKWFSEFEYGTIA
jgi:hypothetical protein